MQRSPKHRSGEEMIEIVQDGAMVRRVRAVLLDFWVAEALRACSVVAVLQVLEVQDLVGLVPVP
jgi:hypothetical protein